MTMLRPGVALLCVVLAAGATSPDAATRRWWSHVRVLASDDMRGRDAGSDGYRRAAIYVADRFRQAGLESVGDRGFLQEVPLQAVDLVAAESRINLVGPDGVVQRWRWLHDITTNPRLGIPEDFDAALAFTGWETPPDLVANRILVALAPPRFTSGPRGYAQTPPPGYFGTLVIDSEEGPEPVRWPPFSTTAMALATGVLPTQPPGTASGFEVNPASAEQLFAGAPHSYRELRAMASSGQRLPSFSMATRLQGHIATRTRTFTSPNVVAVLPGTDPQLSNEAVVVSAHLDGYGVGEAVDGDRIYNGAFDDAAYVATLIDFAERLHSMRTRFKRSIVFCAFTAEERGMLGSQYFVAHQPTGMRIIANVNLDALRPIFPLRTLTVLGLGDSTLGDVTQDVGSAMNIRIQPDPEPDRVLLRRSDQISFLQGGIPAVAFVFGYDRGSQDEAIYRRWYAQRYHAPADDVNQPWDPTAAARFNEFFSRLVAAVANGPTAPAWKPGTTFKR
jgi:hypothetical protein